MALTPGTRLGPYEVVSAIGAGGMGEVYRATDTKLKRQVAIKILPSSLAAEHDRLARFQREAEVLASLNHPNIAAIYGLEESGGMTALVMELVEGDDLSQRLARGAMPLDESLPIAKQIAEALEAAHDQGIIHRDLKPANLKVRGDGTVKVLDFGLAKAMEPAAGSSPSVSQSPTLTTPAATMAGVILGTAAYMSPEQARGRTADKRSDIWSFGVVLFEMLTGRRAFVGEEISDVLAAVLRQDIDWKLLPAQTPESLCQLLKRCLDRDPKQRLRDIGEARIAIDEAANAPDPVVAVATSVISHTRERLAWGTAAAFALLAAGAIAWGALRSAVSPAETRLDVTTPATDDAGTFAISPDGRQLVYAGSASGGPSQLWLRSFDQTTAHPLKGTDGATGPFWSPDSRSVAFFVDNQLKRLDLGYGTLETLASLRSGSRGGSWSAEGVIAFGAVAGPLARVPAAGGAASSPLTKLDAGQSAHRFPHFLPGGQQFLFHAAGASPGVYLGSLESSESKLIVAAESNAVFVPPNWLLFVRQGTLLAQRFDAAHGALTGELISVADRVAFVPALSTWAFSVSTMGSIAYRTGNAVAAQLTWFDRSGKAVGSVGQPDPNPFLQPMLSPDGRRLVTHRPVQGNTDIWLFDGARMTRLTFDPTAEIFPIWSPDGSRIAFSKSPSAKGLQDLYQKSSSGAGQEELLLSATQRGVAPQSWHGEFLIYIERPNPEQRADLWVLPMDGKEKPYPFLRSRFEERMAQFSPDGRWVAYASDESGSRQEIYLRPFSQVSGQWQISVSTAGGVTPRWRRDGRELYYIAPDGKLMAVSVAIKGALPDVGTPTALFPTRIVNGGTSSVGTSWQYDVATDGRFLINVTIGDVGTAPITVIQNWTPRN